MLEQLTNAARSLDVIETVTKEKVAGALEAGRWDAATHGMRRVYEIHADLQHLAFQIERAHFDLIRLGDAPEVFPGQREEFQAAYKWECDPLSPWDPIEPDEDPRVLPVRSWVENRS